MLLHRESVNNVMDLIVSEKPLFVGESDEACNSLGASGAYKRHLFYYGTWYCSFLANFCPLLAFDG
jgi:hypothetical protein